MKWKAFLSVAVFSATLLPQAAWSRNHNLLNDVTNSASSGMLNNITHSGSGILSTNPVTNTGSSLFHNSLLGTATNHGLVPSTLNSSTGILHKRHRGLLAWIRNLLFGSSNSLGTFGNKSYSSYSGSLFNNNSNGIFNNNGGVRGFLHRI